MTTTPHAAAVEAAITAGTAASCKPEGGLAGPDVVYAAAIRAYLAAMAEAGWKLCPREGSPAIGEAMMKRNWGGGDMAEIWAAGFDAAPAPEEG